MQKPQKYDWKDSNLALFGSKTEKDVKKAASEVETAWQPVKECTSDELFVWRIEKFKVKAWPKEDYGKFFSGDSYIVLNVYKDPDGDELLYDVHFWIGKHSTQDEYGTAAYKTVELDTFLDDKAVQHREVQEHESSMFKSYFKTITYLKGGCATGFRQVKPEEYKPRLLHFCGVRRNIEVKEVKLTRKALNSNDVSSWTSAAPPTSGTAKPATRTSASRPPLSCSSWRMSATARRRLSPWMRTASAPSTSSTRACRTCPTPRNPRR
ncbi:hypothetical protein BOX15_Mlig019412g1 [Macrostomum lignano]|uniref:Gelsolin-like domain-containing protein n=1 Tax=Macrostomum lignano TaxID=282301 RepID=A0A267EE01_9PLAT|nr:hypothetical protein BOX15_Mlig019412g1 [Macrostomum lignano]